MLSVNSALQLVPLLVIAVLLQLCPCSLAALQTKQPSTPSIFAGESVGLLHLGASRERVEQLFPFRKDMDQEWPASNERCGTTFLWVDLKPRRGGNVFVHLKDGVVFQIDSATESLHLSGGITVGATPEQVKKQFPNLRAYILSEGTSEAYGMRPLVYWTDQANGMGFAFGYSRKDKCWYLYHIIVFKPGAEICPEPEPVSPMDKKELAPYSLNPKGQ
jgi:hypothetical protein